VAFYKIQWTFASVVSLDSFKAGAREPFKHSHLTLFCDLWSFEKPLDHISGPGFDGLQNLLGLPGEIV
jgi:hypothetical protein